MSNKASNISAVTSNVSNYFRGANKFAVALTGIFVLLVVGLLVYWVYQTVMKARDSDDLNPILVPNPIDPTKASNAKHWKLPTTSSRNSPSLSFTISFWMYVSNWDYRFDEPKAIFIKGTWQDGGLNDAAPGMWLDRKLNRLIVATNTWGDSNGKLEFCDIDNIPLQKWVNVVYVLDNRVVDIYINGKLERSCVLTGVPLLNSRDLYLFPLNPQSNSMVKMKQHGFMGQFSSLRYFSSSLRPVDVARIYNEGPHNTNGADSKDAEGTHGNKGGDSCPPQKDSQYQINFSLPKDL